MAIEYLNLDVQQRSRGQSATAKAAYNSCSSIHDDRTSITFDYKRKSGLQHSEIIFPDGMTPVDRATLWNAVERSETRINSCVSRSLEVALPLELSQDQRTALARDYLTRLSARYDVPVDFSIHEPSSEKRKRTAELSAENPHFHAQFPDRNQTGAKLRQLSKNDTGEVQWLRATWEEVCNRHLIRAGHVLNCIYMDKKLPPEERQKDNNDAIKSVARQIRACELALQIIGGERPAPALARQAQRSDRPDRAHSGSRDHGGGGQPTASNRIVRYPDVPGVSPVADSQRPTTTRGKNGSNIRDAGRDDTRRSAAEPNIDRSREKGGVVRKQSKWDVEKALSQLDRITYRLEQLREQRTRQELQNGQAQRNRTNSQEIARAEAEKSRFRDRSEEDRQRDRQAAAQRQGVGADRHRSGG